MADFSKLSQEFADCSDLLVALGDAKRQAISIKLLAAEKVCAGLQVSDLTETTGLSRPAVSHHLKLLWDAKVVDFRSEGTKNFYYLTHDTGYIEQLRHMLDSVTDIMEEQAE